ncbi:MAG: aromatic-ring-hydroxylating dioxygenase subunit beta [Rhodospirillaceae bacterium]|nr:aromatic-ring-hydroxylating dioxygenase subunit beta [Rhodospirillaceae bacterium]|tara:strand:+ start:18489 stop:18989 length:501 start_codon:yes stop_codon:yes gene_type:complete
MAGQKNLEQEQLRSIELFLFKESQLLDHRQFDDWLNLFKDNGWYWVPISPDQDNPTDTVSIIYDDRKLLETRVRRLNNVNIHAESPPSRTSRIIGNIVVESTDTPVGTINVSSRFQLIEFRSDRQRLFAGTAHHILIPNDISFLIQGKRVDLVNAEGMLEGITSLF